MHIVEHGVIYRDDDPASPSRVACFPGLVRTGDGRLLCTFRVGSTKESADETLRFAESRDEGATWRLADFRPDTSLHGRPGSLRIGHVVETQPGELLFMMNWIDRADPSLPVANPETGGCLEMKLVAFRSTDGGSMWSSAEEITTAPFDQAEISGPPIALARAGHFFLPLENQKAYHDPRPIDERLVGIISRDYGATWNESVPIAHYPGRFHWCNRFARLPRSGELIGTSWTYDGAQQCDLPIHFFRGSSDATSWAAPVSSGIEGQLSTLFPLSDETFLLGYVHRHQPSSIRLRASRDGGRDWNAAAELTIYCADDDAHTDGLGGEIADYYQWMTHYTFGWNPMARLRGGHVMLVYFAGTTNSTSIRFAVVDVGDL